MLENGLVYLMKVEVIETGTRCHKIGMTGNLVERLRSLGYKYKGMNIVAIHEFHETDIAEGALHKAFSHRRIRMQPYEELFNMNTQDIDQYWKLASEMQRTEATVMEIRRNPSNMP